jgi:hypothetical protein
MRIIRNKDIKPTLIFLTWVIFQSVLLSRLKVVALNTRAIIDLLNVTAILKVELSGFALQSTREETTHSRVSRPAE